MMRGIKEFLRELTLLSGIFIDEEGNQNGICCIWRNLKESKFM